MSVSGPLIYHVVNANHFDTFTIPSNERNAARHRFSFFGVSVAIMRPRHTPHILSSFPIYSCAFLSGNRFVLGGGGGASRTGIKNKLVCDSSE